MDQRMAVAEAKSEEVSNEFEEQEEDWDYAGLEAMNTACYHLYPEQPNPRQNSALIKFWFGGPDPLDYIRIYSNPGDQEKGIAAHWHYISFGLTDLHGDGRVHEYTGGDKPSGFGFELTMRVKKTDEEDVEPSWPCSLLRSLSRYVIQTGNALHSGDHIPWHSPLDGKEESVIQHILVTQDPLLKTLTTPYGFLEFRQVVGVTEDEMKAAQKWKGTGVIDLMSNTNEIGPYLITDMQRKLSIFQSDPSQMVKVEEGINQDGSDLGHVTSICRWLDVNAKFQTEEDLIQDDGNEEPKCIDGVHIFLDLEAADLLPLIVRARLQKGKYFMYHNADNHSIHLIPSNNIEIEGEVFVSETEPIKAQGTYLQIYCDTDLQEKMLQEFESLADPNIETKSFPIEFQFTNPTILITVSARGQLTGVETFKS